MISLDELRDTDIDTVLTYLKSDDVDFGENYNSMDDWDKYGFIKKDVDIDEYLKVEKFIAYDNKFLKILAENGSIFECNLKKERKFFEIYNVDFDDIDSLGEWLISEEGEEWLNNSSIFITVRNTKSLKCSFMPSHKNNTILEFKEQVKSPDKVYNAYIKSKNNGGFLVSILDIDVFLPGSLASANKINNFDDLIGTYVNVMFVENDDPDSNDIFIVSNKKYIETIKHDYIKNLKHNELMHGTVTGTTRFGIFIEFSEILTGLLHVSEMDLETKRSFDNNEYKAMDSISFYIKGVEDDDRIILSKYENPEEELTLEDFKNEFENKECLGVITAVKYIGSFIEFNLRGCRFTGLLINKDYKEDFKPKVGDDIKVYIKAVDVRSKKIFLKLPDLND